MYDKNIKIIGLKLNKSEAFENNTGLFFLVILFFLIIGFFLLTNLWQLRPLGVF